MRIALVLLGALVAVILLFLVVGALMPGTFDVERTVTIQAPPKQILAHVADLRQWPNWTPWNAENMPGLETVFEPADDVPTKWTWSDDSMSGGLIVTRSDNSGIAYDLEFEGLPPAEGSITLVPAGDDVNVTWRMSGSVGANPISKLIEAVFSMDDALGTQLESALASLKGKVEKG